jgi:hypothetical protein
MKKVISILLLCGILSIGVSANASTIFFNFEKGGNYSNGPLTGLDTYMDSTFGSNVSQTNANWYRSSLFNSDVIYNDGDTTFDFDPSGSGLPSNFEITSVTFKWGIYDTNRNSADWFLDVYDDATNSWKNDVYLAYGRLGDTGLADITFLDAYEITRLRFHDGGELAVMMDNLTVYDNRATGSPVPEPVSMLLFGTGLIGIGGYVRRRFKK